MTLQDTLLDLEEQFWEAAGNDELYREWLLDGGLMVFPAGMLTRGEDHPGGRFQ